MNFRELRINKNLTQIELAKKLNISRTTITMWERGKSAPRYSMITKIASTLNVSKEEVLNCFCSNQEEKDDLTSLRA